MNFADWEAYFKKNHHSQFRFPLNLDIKLSPTEKAIIEPSIRQFALGESSDGRNLYQLSKYFDYPKYSCAMRYFIKEEQNHSKALYEFMELEDMQVVPWHPLNVGLRSICSIIGLQGAITTLLAAEVIALCYYQALKKATTSQNLQKICTQIIQDELQHLRFQCFSLQKMNQKLADWQLHLWQLYFTILMPITIISVWVFHQKVFRKAGYTFNSYRLWATQVYKIQLRLITTNKA